MVYIDKKRYRVDAYDPNTNIIYEFYGDYWHGNPAIFDPLSLNPSNKKLYGILYNKTMAKENNLIKAEYMIVSIWEADWKQQIRGNI